jgi:predicted ATPase/DNA-binding CsgD family transcriptional regulator
MRDQLFLMPQPQPDESGGITPHNLPAPLTSIIGREQEVTAVAALLARPEIRLLTLTGTGGVGKTRLALAVAHSLLSKFPDGVFFVSLAALEDPDLVIRAIAHTLTIKDAGASSLLALLQAYLRDKRFLLLLDNFEQVLPAAPRLTDLLASCPNLTMLVTSRASLHVRGEQEFPVPPLEIADLAHLPSLDDLSRSPAIALFLARAQAIQPTFQLSAANAPTIAEICARLDGLPLAIELAAARLKLLPPQALLARLEQRLSLLTGGGQNAPARHQTLRKTLAWSYDLLSPEEQWLFRRVSVFVGGFTLQAVEALCQTPGAPAPDALDRVASLLDKSLVYRTAQQPEDEPRFALLETVREFGLECLAEAGETEATRQAHAAYYLQLAEEANLHLQAAEQGQWFDCLERERENLRAAMSFLLERARVEGQPAEDQRQYAQLALRFCTALYWFWYTRMYYREGLRFLEQAIAVGQRADARLRLRALSDAGALYSELDALDRADEMLNESLTLAREYGDQAGMANALFQLGCVKIVQGRYADSLPQIEESAALFLQLGDTWSRARSLTQLGCLATTQGAHAQARALLEEALATYRALGDRFRIALVLYELARARWVDQQDILKTKALAEESLALYRAVGAKACSADVLALLAEIALAQGEPIRAREMAEEAVAIFKEVGIAWETARVMTSLAHIAAAQGDLEAARTCYQEGFSLTSKYSDWLMAVILEGLAAVVAEQGSPAWAAQLWGAAEALRERLGAPMQPLFRSAYDQAVAGVRSVLGEKTFATAWAEGRALTPKQAFAAQPQPMLPRPAPPARATIAPGGLTAREVEVLRLLAEGLTDTQIAERLIISPRTVNNHLTSIYSKLEVSSRVAATRYALEQQLI